MSNTVIVAEKYTAEVQKQLFADNSVLNLMRNASAFLSPNFKTAHIPNAGAASTITVDGSINVAGENVVDYTDTDVLLTLQALRVAPIRGLNFEMAVNSYDSFRAMMQNNIDALVTRTLDHIIYKMVADSVASVITTTGANSTTNNSPAATAKKKFLTLADLRAAQLIMNKGNVKKDGRVLLVNSIMAQELQSDSTVANMLSQTEIGAQKLIEGAIGKLAGFIIVERSWTGMVTSATTALDVTTSEVNTYNYTAIAFQTDSIFYALSPVKNFALEGDPRNYGDICSFEAHVGAINPRTDKKGVVLISQVAA